MAFVVTDNCIQCKYTDCVAVCPADAFHEGPNFMVINPIECIDCGLCVPECTAQAIFRKMNWWVTNGFLSNSTLSWRSIGQT